MTKPVPFFLNGEKIGDYLLSQLWAMEPQFSSERYRTSENCEFHSMLIDKDTLIKLLNAIRGRMLVDAVEVFTPFTVPELLQCQAFTEEQDFKDLLSAIREGGARRIDWVESLKRFANGEIALLPREEEEAIAENLDHILQDARYCQDFTRLPMAQKWRIVQLCRTTPVGLFEFIAQQQDRDPELCKVILWSHEDWQNTPKKDLEVLAQVPSIGDTEISVPLSHYLKLRRIVDELGEKLPLLSQRMMQVLTTPCRPADTQGEAQ